MTQFPIGFAAYLNMTQNIRAVMAGSICMAASVFDDIHSYLRRMTQFPIGFAVYLNMTQKMRAVMAGSICTKKDAIFNDICSMFEGAA